MTTKPAHDSLTEKLSGPWGALLLFAALSVLGTYPMAFHPAAAYLPPEYPEGADYGQFIWTFWWMKKAVLGLHSNLYFTDFLFYPSGASLAFHTMSEYNSLLSIPLQVVFSREIAYNVLFLSSLTLSGLGAYFLGRHITGDRRAAVLAGIIYMYNMNHFSKYGHINLAACQWLPFFFLFYLKSIKGGGRRDYVAAALFFFLAAASAWAFMVFIVLLVGLFLLFTAFTSERASLISYAKSTFWVFAISSVLIAPIAYPMVKELLVYKSFSYEGADTMVGWQDLLGIYPAKGGHGFFFNWLQVYGYTACGLALMAAARLRDRVSAFWFVALAFFFVVSLGPFWAFGGKVYEGIKLPFWYLSKLPVINGVRLPYRYWTMVVLSLSMLGALGFAGLPSVRRRDSKAAGAVFAAVAFLVVFENTVIPRPYWNVRPPEFYGRLKAEPGDFGVLEYPFFAGRDGAYMYFQTFHGKKITSGHISRMPPYSLSLINGNRFVAALKSLSTRREWSEGPWAGVGPADTKELYASGIRYIIIHTGYLMPDRTSRYKDEPGRDKWLPLSLNSTYRGFFDKDNLELSPYNFKDEVSADRLLARLRGLLGEPAYEGEGLVVFKLNAG